MNREIFLKELKKNQEQDLEIVRKKNSDYAANTDPFQNFRGVENWDITTPEKGILVRLSDKMQRICNLIDREAEVEDEKIADTLSDARNYLNILQVYLEDKEKKDKLLFKKGDRVTTAEGELATPVEDVYKGQRIANIERTTPRGIVKRTVLVSELELVDTDDE